VSEGATREEVIEHDVLPPEHDRVHICMIIAFYHIDNISRSHYKSQGQREPTRV